MMKEKLVAVLASIMASADRRDSVGRDWVEKHGWDDELGRSEFVKAEAYRYVVQRIVEECEVSWEEIEKAREGLRV